MRRKSPVSGLFEGRSRQEQFDDNAMAIFGIAVSGASLICYALVTRSQNGKRNRGFSRDSSGTDGGNYTGGDGASLFDGSGHHSVPGEAAIAADSGTAEDSGGGDSGGGGDGCGGSD